jgi:hypothetical protein
MAYIYEVNGQQVEFEREPTDADIDEAARSLGSAATKEPSAAPHVAGAVGEAALGKLSPVNPYGTTLGEAGSAIKSGVQGAASRIGSASLGTMASGAADVYAAMHGLPPVATVAKKAIQSVMPGSGTTVAEGISALGQGAKSMAGGAMNVGKTLAQGAMAPENMFLAPYQMAAYEQAKIRANPTAPGLESNPYAQTVRGEAVTQGQAGAGNAQRALIGQQYGGLSPEEQAIMQQERQRQMMQQQKMQKAKTVLAQPPTPQNYMERMEAMATIYGKVRN